MKLTLEAIMALDTCDDYPEERVAELLELIERPHDTDEEVFELLASIPANHAFWLISNILPAPERVQWAEASARRAREYADGAAAGAARWAAGAARAAADARWAAGAAGRAAAYAAGAARWDAAYWAARAAEQRLAIRYGVQLLGALPR